MSTHAECPALKSAEFHVPLAENGCMLSIYQPNPQTPKGDFCVHKAKKYTTLKKWIANSVIPNHEDFFHAIDTTTQWKRQPFIAFGTRYLEPRDTAWFGDPGCHYSYRNVDAHEILEWSQPLQELKQIVEQMTGIKVNSALLNRYNSGSDYMQKHADDEPELGKQPKIISVTLGRSRLFEVVHKKGNEKHVLSLEPGSMITMHGDTQSHYLHSILKQPNIQGTRINVTFRTVYPELYVHKQPKLAKQPRIFTMPENIPEFPPGEIPDILPKRIFTGRLSLWHYGVHRVPMGAIASNAKTGATSILLATHPFNIDEEHRFVFAGAGGHPHSSDALPTDDQQLSHGNLGLLTAFVRRTPLRVLRLIGDKRHADEQFEYLGGNFFVTAVYNKLVEIPRRSPALMWFFVIESLSQSPQPPLSPQFQSTSLTSQSTHSFLQSIEFTPSSPQPAPLFHQSTEFTPSSPQPTPLCPQSTHSSLQSPLATTEFTPLPSQFTPTASYDPYQHLIPLEPEPAPLLITNFAHNQESSKDSHAVSDSEIVCTPTIPHPPNLPPSSLPSQDSLPKTCQLNSTKCPSSSLSSVLDSFANLRISDGEVNYHANRNFPTRTSEAPFFLEPPVEIPFFSPFDSFSLFPSRFSFPAFPSPESFFNSAPVEVSGVHFSPFTLQSFEFSFAPRFSTFPNPDFPPLLPPSVRAISTSIHPSETHNTASNVNTDPHEQTPQRQSLITTLIDKMSSSEDVRILEEKSSELAPFWGRVESKKLHPLFLKMNKHKNNKLVFMHRVGERVHVVYRRTGTSNLFHPLWDENHNFLAVAVGAPLRKMSQPTYSPPPFPRVPKNQVLVVPQIGDQEEAEDEDEDEEYIPHTGKFRFTPTSAVPLLSPPVCSIFHYPSSGTPLSTWFYDPEATNLSPTANRKPRKILNSQATKPRKPKQAKTSQPNPKNPKQPHPKNPKQPHPKNPKNTKSHKSETKRTQSEKSLLKKRPTTRKPTPLTKPSKSKLSTRTKNDVTGKSQVTTRTPLPLPKKRQSTAKRADAERVPNETAKKQALEREKRAHNRGSRISQQAEPAPSAKSESGKHRSREPKSDRIALIERSSHHNPLRVVIRLSKFKQPKPKSGKSRARNSKPGRVAPASHQVHRKQPIRTCRTNPQGETTFAERIAGTGIAVREPVAQTCANSTQPTQSRSERALNREIRLMEWGVIDRASTSHERVEQPRADTAQRSPHSISERAHKRARRSMEETTKPNTTSPLHERKEKSRRERSRRQEARRSMECEATTNLNATNPLHDCEEQPRADAAQQACRTRSRRHEARRSMECENPNTASPLREREEQLSAPTSHRTRSRRGAASPAQDSASSTALPSTLFSSPPPAPSSLAQTGSLERKRKWRSESGQVFISKVKAKTTANNQNYSQNNNKENIQIPTTTNRSPKRKTYAPSVDNKENELNSRNYQTTNNKRAKNSNKSNNFANNEYKNLEIELGQYWLPVDWRTAKKNAIERTKNQLLTEQIR